MTIGIYCITNKITGEQYVGQSANIERRFEQHKFQKSNSRIHKQIKKYGVNNFEFKIILECKEEELNSKEQMLIELLETNHIGYNETKGGGNYFKRKSNVNEKSSYNCSTNTGFYHVSKCKNPSVEQGYEYTYHYKKYGKRKTISSSSFKLLKEKVDSLNLPFKVLDEDKARKTCNENDVDFTIFQ